MNTVNVLATKLPKYNIGDEVWILEWLNYGENKRVPELDGKYMAQVRPVIISGVRYRFELFSAKRELEHDGYDVHGLDYFQYFGDKNVYKTQEEAINAVEHLWQL